MKRILIFSTNYLPNIGGAELAIKEITERLHEAEFDLITGRFGRTLRRTERVGRVNVHRMGFGVSFDKFLLPFLGVVKAISLHRRQRYDLVWSMMASQASVAAALFKILHRRVPILLTLQEGDEEAHLKRYVFGNEVLYRSLIRPWHTLIFRVADRVSVISKHLEKRAREKNLSVPIVLVPNGVDVQKFKVKSEKLKVEEMTQVRRGLGFGKEDFILVTTSRLVEKNAVGDIIVALTFLSNKVKLLIIGTGGLEGNLKLKTQNLKLEERVKFIGFISHGKLPPYLHASDVFVRPSLSEGMGNSFIEAMAAGVPVVATPVGGITDFLTDKKTGLFCGAGDPKDIALKVQILMRDRELRDAIVSQALVLVLRNYQWSSVAERMWKEAFLPLVTLKKERVLIATGIFPPAIGGPAQYALCLHRALLGLSVSCSVITYTSQRLPTGLRHLVYFFRLLIPLYLADSVIALDTFSSGLPAVLAARLLRRKIVVRVGGDFLWEQYSERTKESLPLPDFYTSAVYLSLKERVIFRLTRFILHTAHHTAFSTEWQRKLWEAPYHLARRKTFVIENFYAPVSAYDRPDGRVEKNFIWAGRAISIKNVSRLKRAFEDARRHNPAVSLETRSEPHAILMEHIARAYAVIVPSISEVSPNLILEAIARGKPFIVTKYNGLADRIGELGLFVDPLDEKALSAAILLLTQDGTYRRFLERLRDFHFVHEWRDIAREFLGLLQHS